MKKIFITATDLFLSLSMSELHLTNVESSSFSIKINFIDDSEIKEGNLILCSRETMYSKDLRTLLSFTGILSTTGKESRFFTGIYDKNGEYESCYLLVVEPEIFETNIDKQVFTGLAKKYCGNENIPVHENGNVVSGDSSLFEGLPRGITAPQPFFKNPILGDVKAYTILYDDYFPLVSCKFHVNGISTKIRFGKFIAENKIKIFSEEEMYLLGARTLFT